jgi:signal transduction histidine kinase
MNQKRKTVSRLSVIFILVVVLSGSILTWFSINNISNLKELTEKRILEEERELASRFSVALQNQIESVSNGFQEPINPAELFIDSLIKAETKHHFIQETFLLKNDGTFLYPRFLDIPEASTPISHSDQFDSNFRKGETAEFREKNFDVAAQNYRSAMKYAKSASDSAKVFVALARVSIKSGDNEKAVQNYINLISNYCDLSDSNGIPYVNFALQQFTQIKDSSLAIQILQTSRECLEKMNTDEIPLTYQTKEILAQFSYWMETQLQKNDLLSRHINTLINSINRQIDFVYFKRDEIINFVYNNDTEKKEIATNRFFVMNSISSNPKELLLINSDSAKIWGFTVNGDTLFETVLQKDLQKDLEFQYTITFPPGYNNNHQQYLTTSALLSPYFNRQSSKIQLAHESALQNIIKRRSWIYGIASVLLLVAMLLGVYLILRDIAREKHLARLQSNFISNVTHELKTPLTSISMFAESILLKRVRKDSDKEEYLSIILKESERLKRMINNILEFSKLEKGKSDYQFVNSNLASLVTTAIHEFDYWFEKEGFEVITELDNKIEAKVDPDKMKQVFENLLNNAIKYSTTTKKIITRLYVNTSSIHIEIEDHGIGIAENEISKIFEEFYRINHRESISGTGLGLTVVNEIVQAHDGKIEVASEVGKGSKFSIILHQQKAEL